MKILMCPPDHFRIGYAINPWMEGNVSQVSRFEARAQWTALHDAIAARAEVALIEPAEDFPDMVFTADAGTVADGVAAASRFAHEERQGEARLFQQWFHSQGLEVHEVPAGLSYEGGDAWLDPVEPWLWAGCGFRSDAEAHRLVGEWLDREVLSLKLIDERFYHLDTCCSVLNRGYVMYYPPAFEDASRALLEARVPAARRIVVETEDVMQFACNAVNIDDTIIFNGASDGLKAKLAAAGFEAIEVPLGEFTKAGGSARCLTLKV
ncbi:MAG TPA: arginine deiminase-related protein [Gammaproteobacteria bacterium]|nr:arginine deiminase-related protein [Gammaproteobacteria bacterium]